MTLLPTAAPETAETDLQLWVEMQITAPPESRCPLIELENQIDALERDHFAGVCTIDVDLREGGHSPSGKRRLTQRMDDSCLCRIFLQHGCSPRIVSSNGTDGVIATVLPDRETLRELVSDIRAVGGEASIRKLVSLEGDTDATDLRTFEMSSLTDKEHEALTVAVERGYYEQPPRISLAELAEFFDVSKQCLSERLNAAEAKMVTSLIGPP